MPAAPFLVRPTPRVRGTLTGVWRRAQFVDRLYVGYFVGLGALIVRPAPRDRRAGRRCSRCTPPAWRWSRRSWRRPAAAGGARLVSAADAARDVPGGGAAEPDVRGRLAGRAAARASRRGCSRSRRRSGCGEVTPPLVAELFQVGYLSYFLLLVIVAGVFRRRGREAPFRGVIAASVLAYLFCYVVFLAWPMEGPVHTLRHLAGPPPAGGPFHALVLLVQRAGVHGNAFPSAHVAGALPPLVFAWRYAAAARRGPGAAGRADGAAAPSTTAITTRPTSWPASSSGRRPRRACWPSRDRRRGPGVSRLPADVDRRPTRPARS